MAVCEKTDQSLPGSARALNLIQSSAMQLQKERRKGWKSELMGPWITLSEQGLQERFD